MSECHFWWKAGEVQWCDMAGERCDCSGWDERCDMKHKTHAVESARLVAQSRVALEDEEEEDFPY